MFVASIVAVPDPEKSAIVKMSPTCAPLVATCMGYADAPPTPPGGMKSGDRRPFGSRATNEIVITRCVTVTLALAYLVVSATLVAVTVRLVPSATPARERSPVVEMLPADADQVTAVFVVFKTVAMNCSVPADGTETDEGEMVTVTAAAVTVTVAVAVAEPLLPVAVAV